MSCIILYFKSHYLAINITESATYVHRIGYDSGFRSNRPVCFPLKPCRTGRNTTSLSAPVFNRNSAPSVSSLRYHKSCFFILWCCKWTVSDCYLWKTSFEIKVEIQLLLSQPTRQTNKSIYKYVQALKTWCLSLPVFFFLSLSNLISSSQVRETFQSSVCMCNG